MILGFWLLSTLPSLLIVSLPIPDGRSSLKISHVHLVKGIVIEVLPGSTAQNFQLANIMCFRLYWDYIPVSSFSGVLQLKRFSSCLYTIPVFYLWQWYQIFLPEIKQYVVVSSLLGVHTEILNSIFDYEKKMSSHACSSQQLKQTIHINSIGHSEWK